MAEWAGVVSAAVAAVGLLFGGWQLFLLNRQARYDRRVAETGVVVSWRAVEAPDRGGDDGLAYWVYEVTAQNPGRLPIDHVKILWSFGAPVRRVHNTGRIDDPALHLALVTPVLAGGESRQWRRRIRFTYADQDAVLHPMYAEITFMNIDGQIRTNRWPRARRP
ncbi:hypothetical protein [Catellatospora paridis]|uniref:hypothetical protein n=1 Tax=Catellatospora paridis TaxID=1617086 RepID=UPI0012D3FDD8|nr:hypothetical protein [Catellatospora paridis]